MIGFPQRLRANAQLHKALLKVAEDPSCPGIIDPQRLEQWLLSVEGKTIAGLKIVCTGKNAKGERQWQLQEDRS